MFIRCLFLLPFLSIAAAAQSAVRIEIREVDLVNQTFAIHADIASAVAGYQLDVSGVTVTAVHGGLAEAANFQTSFSCVSGPCRILSFGFGTQIATGSNGTLCVVEFDCPAADCFSGVTICLTQEVFADPTGTQLISEVGPCSTGIVGLSYCSGNGSATACPCANLSLTGGCANSSGAGGRLSAFGSLSAASDDITFSASGLLPGQPVLLFSANNAVAGGSGVLFGDGLRCAGGFVRRLGVSPPDAAGNASWGPGLRVVGGWNGGDIRRFQGWYRDPVGGPCGNEFNLTNGLTVTFQP